MPLDHKKLRQDAQRLQDARTASPLGQETTGATKVIREALPAIRQLREDGVSWPAIAEALAAQGVVQGKDRIPLTAKRLTALISQIEARGRRKAAKKANRDRGDTAMRPAEPFKRLTLSPDLASSAEASNVPLPSTEDDLRRAAFEKLQTVLKKE
ncbi:hypothetical protein FXB41_11350 [Bradyrhizobium canariense]|uniref:hypothetical protein n=1 Tax=Bradyrhizobium canariense TaxID=255045 RepID=UPI001CA59BB8|nr:hypothetical protein [Bradyrhizobium canariense]MBW5435353.1 hypothetical protein [Bradyrhizobium canariense]